MPTLNSTVSLPNTLKPAVANFDLLECVIIYDYFNSRNVLLFIPNSFLNISNSTTFEIKRTNITRDKKINTLEFSVSPLIPSISLDGFSRNTLQGSSIKPTYASDKGGAVKNLSQQSTNIVSAIDSEVIIKIFSPSMSECRDNFLNGGELLFGLGVDITQEGGRNNNTGYVYSTTTKKYDFDSYRSRWDQLYVNYVKGINNFIEVVHGTTPFPINPDQEETLFNCRYEFDLLYKTILSSDDIGNFISKTPVEYTNSILPISSGIDSDQAKSFVSKFKSKFGLDLKSIYLESCAVDNTNIGYGDYNTDQSATYKLDLYVNADKSKDINEQRFYIEFDDLIKNFVCENIFYPFDFDNVLEVLSGKYLIDDLFSGKESQWGFQQIPLYNDHKLNVEKISGPSGPLMKLFSRDIITQIIFFYKRKGMFRFMDALCEKMIPTHMAKNFNVNETIGNELWMAGKRNVIDLVLKNQNDLYSVDEFTVLNSFRRVFYNIEYFSDTFDVASTNEAILQGIWAKQMELYGRRDKNGNLLMFTDNTISPNNEYSYEITQK